MDDELDVYFERCLKNWASQHKPAADGRERLLQIAVLSPLPKQKPVSHFLAILRDRFFYPEQQARRHNDGLMGPITLSTFWSFQLATNCRMAG